ncbi:MAG: c-type cytochrome [Myxococcales bacterium]|nr:c-type cytochrome [Myxococcales bacterium]
MDKTGTHNRSASRFAAWISVLIASAAVAGSCVDRVSAERRGREVFEDSAYPNSRFNAYSCATCHRATPDERRNLVLPGAMLAGSTRRPTFWGGSVVAFQDAVALCFEKFMRGGRFEPSDDRSIALYAYLDSLASRPDAVQTAVPFTVSGTTSPPGAGDTARGQRLYDNACAYCHGAPRAASRPIPTASILPDDTEREHGVAQGYTAETLAQVFVEKTRHGSFLGFAGFMPPFSAETLSDQDIADIVAYLAPTLR